MSGAYWREVLERGLEVPNDRPLHELTAELTRMLGSPDPQLRDATAYPTLGTWIDRGVYDDLLPGLGDGMAAGLRAGLGEQGTDSVFRRAFSVLVLATIVERDNAQELLPAATLLAWGDQVVGWYCRERDLRGYVADKGWAHAIAHGADAIAALAGSRHLGMHELTVLLDVIADRVISAEEPLLSGEPDRIAQAVVAVLRRGLVPISVLEPWVARVAAHADDSAIRDARDPYRPTYNAQQLLRSVYLLLALGPTPPPHRADLLLVLVDALRGSNPFTLATAK